MNTIIPVSDLKDNLDDILMTAHATAQPIFLTRNGYGDTILMSMDAYEKMQFDIEVCCKLNEALQNEEKNHKYFTVDEAWEAMTKAIEGE